MQRRAFFKSSLAGVAAAGTVGLIPSITRSSRAPRPTRRPGGANDLLRLSANENPLGLSAAARQAATDGLDVANRYPSTLRDDLIKAVASRHAVKVEQVVLGNGSTEVLQMAVQSMGPKATVILADPTFEAVVDYATAVGVSVKKVPLRSGTYAHDLEGMRRAAARLQGPVLVYICNPNNPTGTMTASGDVEQWIASAPENVVFAIDEAYYEYVDDKAYWTERPLIDRHRNVLVVRTFSKIHAMAGMRLGYAIAHPDRAKILQNYAAGTNANALALLAAQASLNDADHERRSLTANREARAALCACLDELELDYIPSQTNFMMHRIPGDLQQYIDRMKEKGILVGRPFPPMLSYNRVSIPLPEELARFTDTLRSFRRAGWV